MSKAKKVVTTLETVGNVPMQMVSSEDRHPRMLIIEFVGDAPNIMFKGEWAIKHLLTIKRCLSREFKKYRRDVIRTNITNKED